MHDYTLTGTSPLLDGQHGDHQQSLQTSTHQQTAINSELKEQGELLTAALHGGNPGSACVYSKTLLQFSWSGFAPGGTKRRSVSKGGEMLCTVSQ